MISLERAIRFPLDRTRVLPEGREQRYQLALDCENAPGLTALCAWWRQFGGRREMFFWRLSRADSRELSACLIIRRGLQSRAEADP